MNLLQFLETLLFYKTKKKKKMHLNYVCLIRQQIITHHELAQTASARLISSLFLKIDSTFR
uniref:Uncharacterized protein n=1 Tax=Candidozyma auris TaxID=498019 RepID=A0A0L0P8T0_CANAR